MVSPGLSRRLGCEWRLAALALAMLALALPCWADEICSAHPGVQLVKQQLMPTTPAYYLPCGFPAASTLLQQIAVADGDAALGPSSCTAAVCLFSVKSGRKLRTQGLTQTPQGVELSAQIAPLIESLRQDGFHPMRAMQLLKRRGVSSWEQGPFRIDFHRNAGTAFVVARGSGYASATYRFPSRAMRCVSHPTRQALPQEISAWALEGVAALAVAALYLGQEPGCSLTQWVIVPLRQKTKP